MVSVDPCQFYKLDSMDAHQALVPVRVTPGLLLLLLLTVQSCLLLVKASLLLCLCVLGYLGINLFRLMFAKPEAFPTQVGRAAHTIHPQSQERKEIVHVMYDFCARRDA